MSIRIDGTNTTANPGITGADADTGLQFGTDEISFVTGGTNRATVESNGNFTIESGNLVLASGNGIDFSADPNAAGMTSELLDDYEEGTFTPVFQGGTTAGTYTYTSQTGFYTKIGNLVYVNVGLANINTTSAGSGSMQISGLPFANNSVRGATGAIRYDVINIVDSANGLVAITSPSSQFVQIFEVKDDGADTAADVGDITAGATDIFFNITYTTG
jgi:hypothetical protein